MSATPLVIDLDGTLLKSDLLLESGLAFLKHHPLMALSPLKWLSSGKANLKARPNRFDCRSIIKNKFTIKEITNNRYKECR